jgi:transcription antitermination factor NusG
LVASFYLYPLVFWEIQEPQERFLFQVSGLKALTQFSSCKRQDGGVFSMAETQQAILQPSSTSSATSSSASHVFPEWVMPRWYAVYTAPHHEKRVREQLMAKRVETFLPVYTTVHRWKDRTAKLQLPLFPSYLFTHLPLRDRLQVLQVPGVVNFVGTGGRPVPLPDHEIEALRKAAEINLVVRPHPYLKVGSKVRIKTGPFEGLQGILSRRKGSFRVVLSLELIASAFVLEIDVSEVEPMNNRRIV